MVKDREDYSNVVQPLKSVYGIYQDVVFYADTKSIAAGANAEVDSYYVPDGYRFHLAGFGVSVSEHGICKVRVICGTTGDFYFHFDINLQVALPEGGYIRVEENFNLRFRVHNDTPSSVTCYSYFIGFLEPLPT